MTSYLHSNRYLRPLAVDEQPLVSVISPVYNGEEFLAECIESVLSQSYQNWDYTIVNNCSSDRTLAIAESYAARDPRIRVRNCREFLPIIQNHNRAIGQISPQSRYCKVLLGDDWLFPDCIMRMVALAENLPAVGLVGAYGLDGLQVLWQGVPYQNSTVSGREICRDSLLGGPYVFGTPTSLLVRSDLVRAHKEFYNEANLHADNEACFELLQRSDFGFVHQILTYSRPRLESTTAAARQLESYILGNLSAIVNYGLVYLTPNEYESRLEQWLRQYYKVLAKSLLRFRGTEFWEFHRKRLETLGLPLDHVRLATATAGEMVRSLVHPVATLDGVLNWWPKAISHMDDRRAR